MSRFAFTAHAIDRYIQRHAPMLTVREARVLLETESAAAVRLKEKTIMGQTMWRLSDPPCTLVTKPEDGGWVVVTILPAFRSRAEQQNALAMEWAEILRERSPADPIPEIDEIPTPATRPSQPTPEPPEQLLGLRARAASQPKPDLKMRLAHSEAMYRATLEHAARKDREKTIRMAISHDERVVKMKRALATALRYALKYAPEEPGAAEILDAVARIDPQFVTREFLGRAGTGQRAPAPQHIDGAPIAAPEGTEAA